jgi:hypothetical protein
MEQDSNAAATTTTTSVQVLSEDELVDDFFHIRRESSKNNGNSVESQIYFCIRYFEQRRPPREKTWKGKVPTSPIWKKIRKMFTSPQVAGVTFDNIDLERMETILYDIMATMLMTHSDEAFLYDLLDNLVTKVTEILIRRQHHRHREC